MYAAVIVLLKFASNIIIQFYFQREIYYYRMDSSGEDRILRKFYERDLLSAPYGQQKSTKNYDFIGRTLVHTSCTNFHGIQMAVFNE